LAVRYPGIRIDVEVITTRGDEMLSSPLPELEGKGLFTAELEDALLSGRIDIAVHSLKDLPVESAAGITIGAVPKRANPADVLVSRENHTFGQLPRKSIVGTSSPRRTSQLLHIRNDLRVKSVRGNVDTRIRKTLETEWSYDAVVLAHAGLERLGRLDVIAEVLDVSVMLPAPGQGALGVQCRDDESSLDVVRSINDPATETAAEAERAFLLALGGGCSLPISALGIHENGGLHLRGRVTSPDGSNQIDVAVTADVRNVDDARSLGMRLARKAVENGATDILEADR
jgi:hydroxymethylbilane synthase